MSDKKYRAMVGGMEVEILGFHSHWNDWEGPWVMVQPIRVHYMSYIDCCVSQVGEGSNLGPTFVETRFVWFQEVSPKSDARNFTMAERMDYSWLM